MSLVDDVRILGAGISNQLREAIIEATLDTSITQVSQLTLRVIDPGWKILGSGIIAPNMRVELPDFVMSVAAVETLDEQGIEGFEVACRPMAVRRLKERTGPLVLQNLTTTEFIQYECDALSIPLVAQISARYPQIARDVVEPGKNETSDEIPSSWTTFKRLAQLVGFIVFESNGTIYYGRPSWFLQNFADTAITASYKSGAEDNTNIISIPVCRRTLDSVGTTVSFSLPIANAAAVHAGMVLNLTGVSTFNGPYLITSTKLDLLKNYQQVDIEAATPLDPELGDQDQQPHLGTKLNIDFLYWVQAQIGDSYEVTAVVNIVEWNPNVFNGYELVAWGATQTGLYMPRNPDDQMSYMAFNGTEIPLQDGINLAGAILWRTGNVGISLGNDNVIENVGGRVGIVTGGAADRYQRAGKIPGMKY